MRRLVQTVAGGASGVILGVLATFWAVRGTQPSGHWAMPALYGGLVTALTIWAVATFAFRQRGSRGPALGVVIGDSWVAAPQSTLKAMAVELTVTNAGRDRASVEVSFELRMDDGRWSRERPLAPGAVLDGHPHMGVLAVSGSPVAVEARDSYHGWFGVEIGNPRLRAPLDIRVVVMDLLSGARATAVVSGAPEPVAVVPSDGVPDAVRGALLREYRAGEQLVAGNQSPIGARISLASRMTMPPMTTAAAVEQWEKRVVHLLHRAECWELADHFLADVPAPPTPTMEERIASSRAAGAIVASMKVDGPRNPGLGRRLDFRLAQLNTIIKRKL